MNEEVLSTKVVAFLSSIAAALIAAIWKLYFHPRIKAKQNNAIAHDEADEEIAKKTASILGKYEKLWMGSEERKAELEKEVADLHIQLAMCVAKCQTLEGLLNEHQHKRDNFH